MIPGLVVIFILLLSLIFFDLLSLMLQFASLWNAKNEAAWNLGLCRHLNDLETEEWASLSLILSAVRFYSSFNSWS